MAAAYEVCDNDCFACAPVSDYHYKEAFQFKRNLISSGLQIPVEQSMLETWAIAVWRETKCQRP